LLIDKVKLDLVQKKEDFFRNRWTPTVVLSCLLDISLVLFKLKRLDDAQSTLDKFLTDVTVVKTIPIENICNTLFYNFEMLSVCIFSLWKGVGRERAISRGLL